MTSDIDTFTAPSTERPPSAVPVDWAAVEDWLGLRLPADYKRLADRYGPLDFGEYLWIHVPCVQRDRFDYGEWLRGTHREARIEARELPEAERPVLHSEPGGLLAWGCTRGSDVLFWDTSASDDPDAWTVVVRHSGAVPGSGLLPWHRYDLTLTGYLRHTVRDTWELTSPPGPLLGPLPGTVARTGSRICSQCAAQRPGAELRLVAVCHEQRLRNSGRNRFRSSSISSSFNSAASPSWPRMRWAPMSEVMMTTVGRQSTVRPWPSVSRPSPPSPAAPARP